MHNAPARLMLALLTVSVWRCVVVKSWFLLQYQVCVSANVVINIQLTPWGCALALCFFLSVFLSVSAFLLYLWLNCFLSDLRYWGQLRLICFPSKICMSAHVFPHHTYCTVDVVFICCQCCDVWLSCETKSNLKVVRMATALGDLAWLCLWHNRMCVSVAHTVFSMSNLMLFVQGTFVSWK